MTQLETERKYIIRKPACLDRLACWRMEQTYLLCETGTERVRLREQNGIKEYYFTRKERLTAVTARETERRLSETEYLELLHRRDPARRTVYKTRYLYPYQGQLFEIDVYPFWQRQCVMEIELEGEAQEVRFPPDIEIIREVTEDYRYKNARLAAEIPEELI